MKKIEDKMIEEDNKNKIKEIEKRIEKLEGFHFLKDKNKIQLKNCNDPSQIFQKIMSQPEEKIEKKFSRVSEEPVEIEESLEIKESIKIGEPFKKEENKIEESINSEDSMKNIESIKTEEPKESEESLKKKESVKIEEPIQNEEPVKNEEINKEEEIKKLDEEILEYKKKLEELESKHSIEDLNKELSPFVLAKGAAKALTLLNDPLYFKLFKNEETPQSDIILIYRIYFQLVNKEKEILMLKNDNDFWIKVKEYFSNFGEGKIGSIIEEQFKELDFSYENFVILDKICEGNINKLTPVYYSKLCPTTGLFVFLVKEALEYIGVLQDKKTQPGRIYKNLNYLIENAKAKKEELSK